MADFEGMSPESLQLLLQPEQQTEEPPLTGEGLSSLLQPAPVGGAASRERAAGYVAALGGNLLKPEAVEVARLFPDQEEALDTQAQQLFADIEQQIASDTAKAAGTGLLPANELATLVSTAMQDNAKDATGPAANEQAILKALASVPLDKAVEKDLAFTLAAQNEVIKLADSMGMVDYAMDIGGLFIPFRNTREWEDLKEGVENNQALNKELTGDSIASMIGSFQQLPTERKAALWPALVETTMAASGFSGTDFFGTSQVTDSNTLIAIGMLMRFLQPEGGERAILEQRIGLGLDIVGSVGALKAVASTLKGAKASKATSAFRDGLGGKSAFEKDIPKDPTAPSGARKPTPDESFPTTDPSKGVTIDGEVLGKFLKDMEDIPIEAKKAMEAIIYRTADYARRNSNIPKVLKSIGEDQQAAQVILAGLDSPTVARASGIQDDIAFQSAMPWQVQEWLPEVVADLSPELGTQLNSYFSKVDGFTRSMLTESELLRLGLLTKPERGRARNNFFAEMDRKGEDYLQEGMGLQNINITKELANGFEFEYTMVHKDGTQEPVKGFRAWKMDEVTGRFTETATDLATTTKFPGQSPTAWSSRGEKGELDFLEAAKEAQQVSMAGQAMTARINKAWLEGHDGLVDGLEGRRRLARVEAVELAGDEYINPDSAETGRTFLPAELLAGIHTPNGTVFLTDPKDVQLYYNRRIIAGMLHAFENHLVREELLAAKMKSIAVTAPAGDQIVTARPFDTLEGALRSVQRKPSYGAWDARTSKVEVITPELLSEAYDQGMHLARTRKDWNTTGNEFSRGGEYVEYVLVKADNILPLPEQVLHYRDGYVPKIRTGIEYTVVRQWPIAKKGTTGSMHTEVVNGYASKMDADRAVNALIEKEVKAGVPRDVAERMYARQEGPGGSMADRVEGILSSSNGLYTGTRSKGEIIMGFSGKKAERLSPTEAYGRNVGQVGDKLSKNLWIAGLERRWLNTARSTLPEGSVVTGFNSTALPSDDMGKALEQMRDQIRKWSTVPSRKESMIEAGVQQIHDWVLNGSRGLGIKKDAIASIMWLKHTDPVSAIMAANMHLTLGVLNPAQLYVQASAMTVALSMAPFRDIPNILELMAVFSVLDNVKDETTVGKVFKFLLGDKTLGPALRANEEMYNAWRRSGLTESVRGNADMNYHAATGLGLTADWMRKAGNVSLMLYRQAELANRRVSFIAAFREHKRANPGVPVDDDFLSGTLSTANEYMWELDTANKAWWQGGNGANSAQKITAMFGQFSQVLTRTLEFAMKGQKHGGWSLRRKARFTAGQMLLFGAAGVPLLSLVGPFVAQQMVDALGLDPNEDAETINSIANTINQGTSGVFAWEFLGAEVDVADRAALGGGVFQQIKEVFTSKDPFWIKMLGLTGTTGKRVGDVITNMQGQVMSLAMAELAALEPLMLADRSGMMGVTPEDYLAAVKDMFLGVSGLTTTTRNLLKSHLMQRSGIILDNRGRVLTKTEFTWQTELAVAMGFRPSQESRIRAVEQGNRYWDEVIRDMSDTIIGAYHRYIYIHEMQPGYANNLRRNIQVLQESLDNPNLKEQLRRSLASRMFENPQTLEERAIAKYIETIGVENIASGLIKDSENVINFKSMFEGSPVILPLVDLGKDRNIPKIELSEDEGEE